MTRGQGNEGQSVRLGKGIPRTGQAGADGIRRKGAAVGRRLADLSALEAEGGDERQDADLRRHEGDRPCRQDDRVRRSSALPDRLRVLQRRCDRRPDAGRDVSQGLARRRLVRHAGPHPRRHRLGRHASHGEQLRARSGRGPLFPRGDVHAHAGRDPLGPDAPQRRCRRLSLRAADSEVRGLRDLSLRQSARPRLGPLGAGFRVRRHGRQPLSRRALLRASRLSGEACSSAAGLSAAHPPLPRRRKSSRAGIFPIRCKAICSWRT